MELNKTELVKVDGGAISWTTVGGIGAILAYLVGIISGYTNPTRCNN